MVPKLWKTLHQSALGYVQKAENISHIFTHVVIPSRRVVASLERIYTIRAYKLSVLDTLKFIKFGKLRYAYVYTASREGRYGNERRGARSGGIPRQCKQSSLRLINRKGEAASR